ncbi:hypothetical protein A2U01_0053549, partial [Trifolium medium]|nr:hypothetical protein [Trifolium medium]
VTGGSFRDIGYSEGEMAGLLPSNLGIPVVVLESLVNFEGDKGDVGFVEAEGSELRLEDEHADKGSGSQQGKTPLVNVEVDFDAQLDPIWLYDGPAHLDVVVPFEKAVEGVYY